MLNPFKIALLILTIIILAFTTYYCVNQLQEEKPENQTSKSLETYYRVPKPEKTVIDEKTQETKFFKFKTNEGTEIRYNNEKKQFETEIKDIINFSNVYNDVEKLNNLLTKYPDIIVNCIYFDNKSEEKEGKLKLESKSGLELADWSLYHYVYINSNKGKEYTENIINDLNSIESIELAFPKNKTYNTQSTGIHCDTTIAAFCCSSVSINFYTEAPNDCINNKCTDRQVYMKDSGLWGMEIDYASLLSGSDGSNIQIVDIEDGWPDHRQLPYANICSLSVTSSPWNTNNDSHGLGVSGILLSQPSNNGIIGIVPNAKLCTKNSWYWFIPWLGIKIPWPDDARAIRDASQYLNAGDVILIEQQYVDNELMYLIFPFFTSYVPIESHLDVRLAMREAYAKGIIVVEAAGNGQVIGGCRGSIVNQEYNGTSQAMLVGAGEPCSNNDISAGNRSCFSNYGSAVRIQSWGSNVITLGLNNSYRLFSGTSSASALVAGAVSKLQSIFKTYIGHPLSPEEVKNILWNTGTCPSSNTAAISWGVNSRFEAPRLPNLRAALNSFGIYAPETVQVSITSPQNPFISGIATISGVAASTVNNIGTPGSGIKTIEYSINNSSYSLANGTNNWNFNIDGNYYKNINQNGLSIKVKATSYSGNVSETSRTFYVGSPVIQLPLNNATFCNSESVTLKCNDYSPYQYFSSQDTSYEINIDTIGTFYTNGESANSAITINTLPTGNTYNWKVRAKYYNDDVPNINYYSEWSDWNKFSIVTCGSNSWLNKTTTNKPEVRNSYSIANIYGNDKIMLFGGSGNSGRLDDIWIYDLSDNNWTNPNPSVKPSARFCSQIDTVFNDDKIILFGGSTSSGFNNETWVYDLSDNNWTNMNPTVKPSARELHSMATIFNEDKVVIFSGRNCVDDTWIYDLSDNNWTNPNPSTKPTQRSYHSMATIFNEDKILLFGGYGVNNIGDTWIYDLSDNNWTNPNPSTKPSARANHDMAALYNTDKILLFGGSPDLNADPVINLDDIWIYDLSDNNWTNPNPSVKPSARRAFGASTIYNNNKMLIFGGYDDNNIGDTWIYEP